MQDVFIGGKRKRTRKHIKNPKTEFRSFLANQKINIAEKTIGTPRNGRGKKEFSGRRFKKYQLNINRL